MARASTRTLLPLDRFAAILGISPLHFNQVYIAPTPDDMSTARTCDVPIMQFAYQTADRIGREDIAEAIALAEDMIFTELKFKTAPDWITDEHRLAAQPYDPRLLSGSYRDIRGFFGAVQTQWGYVESGGIRGTTLIEAAAPIVYSDPDGDGYDELATITVATTVTDPAELALFYPGHAADEGWQIRPLKSVSIAGGIAIIQCYRQQLVLESLTEGLFPISVLGTDDANFLTTIDVYRVYNDPSNQVEFQWSNDVGCCSSGNCLACTYSSQTGCISVRERRLGMVATSPGVWDVDNTRFDFANFSVCRGPDRLVLNYRAGLPAGPLNSMQAQWERIITHLAVTFLRRPLCACEPISNGMRYWATDLAQISSGDQTNSWQISRRRLDNPFGTTRGAISAWDLVQKYKIGEAA